MFGFHFGVQQVGEVAAVFAGRRHHFDAAFTGKHGSIDDIHGVDQVPFEQACRESGCEQLGVPLGQITAKLQGRLTNRSSGCLGLKQTESASEINERPHFVHLGSVDGRHVHGTLDDPLRQEVHQQMGRFDGDGFLSFDRGSSQVGRQNDVRCLEQRVISRDRFDFEHVQAGSGDMFRCQRVSQSMFIDHAAASDVHHTGTLGEHRQFAGIDEVFGLGREGDVQREIVTLRQQFIFGSEGFDAEFGCLFGSHERIVANHFHVESDGSASNFPANSTQTDHTEGFPGYLRAKEALAIPFARFHTGIGSGNMAGYGEEKGNRMLGGRNRVPARSIHDDHPGAGRRHDINVINTHAGADDSSQVPRIFQFLAGDLCARANDGAVTVANCFLKCFPLQTGAVVDFDPRVR